MTADLNRDALLANIVRAWEALPGGKQQSVRDVERWLASDMAPSINRVRAYLAALPASIPEDINGLVERLANEIALGSTSAMDWNTSSLSFANKLLATLTTQSAELAEARAERDGLGSSLRNYATYERLAQERAEAAEARATALETELATTKARLDELER